MYSSTLDVKYIGGDLRSRLLFDCSSLRVFHPDQFQVRMQIFYGASHALVYVVLARADCVFDKHFHSKYSRLVIVTSKMILCNNTLWCL